MTQIKAEELKQWINRAEKLGRTNKHLAKIQQVIDRQYNHGFGYVKLSERDYKALLKDNKDYLQKLESNSQNQKSSDNSIELKSNSIQQETENKIYKTTHKKEKPDNLTEAQKEALYGLISRGAPYSHGLRF